MSKLNRLYAWLVLVIVVASGCGDRASVNSAGAPPAPVTAGVEDEVSASLERLKIPGAAVALVKEGKVVYTQGFGYRDAANKLPMTADTLFAVGGITKTFTSSGVALLVDEGKMAFDTPVRDLVPGFSAKSKMVTEKATVRDLLAERTGFPHHKLMFSLYPTSKDEVFKRLRYLPGTGDFRKKFHASDLNYLVAGIALEQISRATLSNYIQDRLLKILGMNRTLMPTGALALDSDLAVPYLKGLKPVSNSELPESAQASTGIQSTAGDLGKWLLFHINRGNWGGSQVIADKTMRQVHSHQVKATESTGYAMGWAIDAFRHHRRAYHFGRVEGANIYMAYLSAAKVGVVVAVNDELSWYPHVLGSYFMDMLLEIKGPALAERLDQRETEEKAIEPEAPKAAPIPKVAAPVRVESDESVQASAAPQMRMMAAAAPMAPMTLSGIYAHPAYGLVEIEDKAGAITLSWGDMLKASHAVASGRDEITLPHDANAKVSLPPLHIERSADGKPSGIAWKLEPETEAIQFKKQ